MQPEEKRRAIVLLSGGMDSSTAAAMVARDGYEIHGLAIRYGQRHVAELRLAARLARALGAASFRIVDVDLRALGGSALTDDIAVPKDRSADSIGTGIPITYVPARNTVFLALALAAAETCGAEAIVLGVNALDYSGYPDCRPEFVAAFEQVAALGTRQGVEGRGPRILAPLQYLTKAEIATRGHELGVPFQHTLSCYDPVERGSVWLHCGRCDACHLRARGFAEAGLTDPAPRVEI
ncbi:MAG: 7-cyano-7-deazaguanine synthase QueC [Planctomycetota bacterium]|nr:7-cyano-7-deazaguanine synthase QueC [Planctomycetota bacterium]